MLPAQLRPCLLSVRLAPHSQGFILLLLLSQKRRCTTNDSASSVRLPSRGGFPLRPAPLTPAYPLPKGLPVQLGFFFGAPTPKKTKGASMGGTSPRAGSYAIYLPCHSVQRGERLYCVARWLGCRPSAALIGAPPCSVPQRASAAPLGLAGSPFKVVARAPLARLRRWCARRFYSATSSADIAPSYVQCAAVVRSLCSVRSLAAACRCWLTAQCLPIVQNYHR